MAIAQGVCTFENPDDIAETPTGLVQADAHSLAD